MSANLGDELAAFASSLSVLARGRGGVVGDHGAGALFLMKLRTILNIPTAERMSSIDSLIGPWLGRLDRALIYFFAYNGL